MMIRVKDFEFGSEDGSFRSGPIALHLGKGELLRISGENGAGKSLLARALLGLAPVLGGEAERNFSSFAYLPQSQNLSCHLPYSLFDVLPPQKNLEEKALALGLMAKRHFGIGWNKASGGERQRTLLTRFFLAEAELLVLDEPLNHLDHATKSMVKGLFREKMKAGGKSAILVSHEDSLEGWLGGVRGVTLELERRRHD
jgi:zinc transport system ATP-binding protein